MNNDKCQYECKKCQVYEADYVWNPFTCDNENEKYLASIIDDSAIRLDKIIDADGKAKSFDKTKTIPTNFDEKKVLLKQKNLYILLSFLSVTIALLIPVIIYCYLIKLPAKQLLPSQYTNNEKEEVS